MTKWLDVLFDTPENGERCLVFSDGSLFRPNSEYLAVFVHGSFFADGVALDNINYWIRLPEPPK